MSDADSGAGADRAGYGRGGALLNGRQIGPVDSDRSDRAGYRQSNGANSSNRGATCPRMSGTAVDYVNSRIAPHHLVDQPWNWLANVPRDQVRVGDVAIFRAENHAAYVERVHYDPQGHALTIDIAEMNYGSKWVDRRCLITDRFNFVSRRLGIPVAQAEFIRPVR
jgi:hypothetical protein